MFLSRDPVYLLGLMDSMDSDNSDDDFDSYMYLDDSMQSTTEIKDDTSTHMLDGDNSSENLTLTNDINNKTAYGTNIEVHLTPTM